MPEQKNNEFGLVKNDASLKPGEKFEVRQVSGFIFKSVSKETRRAYSRVVKEFFGFVGNIQPWQVGADDVLRF